MDLRAILAHKVSKSPGRLVNVTNGLKDSVLTHVLGRELIARRKTCDEWHRIVHEIDILL